MDKLKPRAIIFDLGSTLIEYEATPWDEMNPICVEEGRKFLEKEGIEIPVREKFEEIFEEVKQEYRTRAAETLVEWDVPMVTGKFFEKLRIKFDQELVDRFFDAYYRPVDENLFIYDDVAETLQQLKVKYPTIGLISNTVFPERAHLTELERFGIAPYFNFTIFSSTFKLRKPHRDIFLKAANLAGCAPSECVYIGDRYYEDVEGPTGVGMPAILKILEKREYPQEMSYNIPRIKTLSEIFNHIA